MLQQIPLIFVGSEEAGDVVRMISFMLHKEL